ncbi:MAG: VOC family protein [Spirochaetales bacterium]|nr:VOC family protein [Spirochaetales bacterium]
MKRHAIPDGFGSITPYLIVRSVPEAVAFYGRAFGAVEGYRMQMQGMVMHTHITIGDGKIMLAEEFPDEGFISAETLGRSPAAIHLYVEDAVAAFDRAVTAGATSIMAVEEQFFGDIHGIVEDPFRYRWTIATHVEDVPEAELERRIREYDLDR